MRPIHIVTASDDHRELEGAVVTLHEKFSSSLGGRVRIRWLQHVVLHHRIGVEVFAFTIDFIRGNMNETLDGRTTLGALQKHVGSVDIGVRKGKGVSEGVVHMSLGCEVHDGVDGFLLEDVADKVRGANVALHKLEVGQVFEFIQIRETRAIVELVVYNDVVFGVLFAQQNGNMGSNETCRGRGSGQKHGWG